MKAGKAGKSGLPKTEDQCKRKIEQMTKSLEKEVYKVDTREQNKEIALGTSKLNYMDPRITVAWCKKNEVPIEKLFS